MLELPKRKEIIFDRTYVFSGGSKYVVLESNIAIAKGSCKCAHMLQLKINVTLLLHWLSFIRILSEVSQNNITLLIVKGYYM
jgi:hypothetical protein